MRKILYLMSVLFVLFVSPVQATNPRVVSCPANTWTKVATNVTGATITPKRVSSYFYTFRDTGGAVPTNLTDATKVPLEGKTIAISTGSPLIDIYVLSQNKNGKVIVWEGTPLDRIDSSISDLESNIILSSSNAIIGNTISVAPGGAYAGSNNLAFRQYVRRLDDHSSVLSEDSTIGSVVVRVTVDYSDFNDGERLCIGGGLYRQDCEFIITDTPGSPVLQLNRPIDVAYPAGTILEHITINLNSNGSLASPFEYTAPTPPGFYWYVTGAKATILDDSAMPPDKFGSITALANGLTFSSIQNGETFTLKVMQDNAEVDEDASTVQYVQRVTGGDFLLTANWVLSDYKTFVILNGNNIPSDSIKVLIQDNLTTLTRVRIRVFGFLIPILP